MKEALAIIFILLMFIIVLIIIAIMQIRMAGIKVKDFFSFIDANQKLDSLVRFAQKYDKMSPQEQIIYLTEAEKMFDSFDKIPSTVWEDERDKYTQVLDTYKNIRVMRWNEAQTNAMTTAKSQKIRPKEIKTNN